MSLTFVRSFFNLTYTSEHCRRGQLIDISFSATTTMGLVNSVGSRAMRPPNPPSYGLEADGDGWRFTSPPLDYGCAAWSPQNNYANGCPIGFPGARKARSSHLAHTVTKRRSAETGRDIALLRVYSTEPSAARPTLLYSKGNSFDMGMLRYHCVQLAQLLDVDVVYYDYGGYGASSGAPSAAGTVADARVAADYVEELGVPWSRVILYGFSLGNGPTCALAGDVLRGRGLRGVILRSGFVSGVAAGTDLVQRYAASYVPAGALPSWMDVWPNEKRCADFDAPTLVVHGSRDELLSMWHAERLLAALPEGRRAAPFFEDMGHFDVERHPAYVPRLRTFIHGETAKAPAA